MQSLLNTKFNENNSMYTNFSIHCVTDYCKPDEVLEKVCTSKKGYCAKSGDKCPEGYKSDLAGCGGKNCQCCEPASVPGWFIQMYLCFSIFP